MSQKNEIAEKDPQVKKIKEYSRRVTLLKPVVGVDEPEGKINKNPQDSGGE